MASVAAAAALGREIGPVLHPPYERRIPGPIPPGGHQLTVEVFGNMRNRMGSHHHENLPLRWTYEYGPEHMPAGRDYRLSPSGLLADPDLFG